MRNRFFETAFTPHVLAEQDRHGSRAAYAKFTSPDDTVISAALLTRREAAFIAARDSFYLATISETGWPHVQHRGGPIGFVRPLDERTIGWADFVGNRQYVSIGNSAYSDKAALIFVDYPNRARLKVLGHLAAHEAADRPDLEAALAQPDYQGRIEHFITLSIEAFDWNCPQHITPRFTADEIAAAALRDGG